MTREFAATNVTDCEEPRLDIRAAKRVEITRCARIAQLLHGIFGIRRVARQICQRVSIVEMGQCGIAKTPCFFLVSIAAVARHYAAPGFPGYRDHVVAVDQVVSAPRCCFRSPLQPR